MCIGGFIKVRVGISGLFLCHMITGLGLNPNRVESGYALQVFLGAYSSVGRATDF